MIDMSEQPGTRRTALIACESNLIGEPRVRTQIDWLVSEGWVVDTLGRGPHPSGNVRNHFVMGHAPWYSQPRLVKGLIYTFLPFRLRSRILTESMIPAELKGRTRRGSYDLLLVHDLVFLPWAANRANELVPRNGGQRHIDLHEHFLEAPPAQFDRITRLLIASYHRWVRHFIGSSEFTSRSTVASGIADLYEDEFRIRPSVVRNTTPYFELSPSSVDAAHINLVYHGNADLSRGLSVLIDATRLLDARFTLNLMLTGSVEGQNQLRALTSDIPDRVAFVDPVPLREVPNRLNDFDLEVMFFPPVRPSLLYALPNKLFEAVQGRLGLVIGPSPCMAEIVNEFNNGVVVDGWTAEDLASGINALTPVDVEAMKAASDRAAKDLNSEKEKYRFLGAILEPPMA
jgi:glycosyltransferase involved in cell wall biosynthesis